MTTAATTVNGTPVLLPRDIPSVPLRLDPAWPVSPWPRQPEAPVVQQEPRHRRRVRHWPLVVIASPAAVAIWSGWVALGALCGFGLVDPFPGIVRWHLDTAITLPVGVEAYGAYALGAWLSPGTPRRARQWARWSAIGSLSLGAAGQVIYHLLAAARATRAPWPVVVVVSCIPVVTLGCAAALTHLLRAGDDTETAEDHRDGDGNDETEDSDIDHDPEPPKPPTPPRPARSKTDKVTDTMRRHPDWDNRKVAAYCGASVRTVQRRRDAAAKGKGKAP